MGNYYLAIDIGASSGRHILGKLTQGKLELEEVYRFENGMQKESGHLIWDYDQLFREIKNGLRECAKLGKIPVSAGVDTWGVDHVLLDENDKICAPAYAYRDIRNEGIPEKVASFLSDEELYRRTGIQKMQINTIYQLYATKLQEPDTLTKAKTLLMTADYFHFLLTGNKLSEYTLASTSELIDVRTCNWDRDLIEKIGIDPNIFLDVSMPGTKAGKLRKEIADEIGYSCDIVLPASHDTASAVMAIPNPDGDSVYISSGTWSLMGCELTEPMTSEKSMRLNFTNEGGYGHRYRYLKNIMGLWMIQSVRKELNKKYSFDELCEMAEASEIESLLDCEDPNFLAPESMIAAIKEYCKTSGQTVPETIGDTVAVIYNSLAKTYGDTIKEIESVTGKTYTVLNIFGGGSKDGYLNALTAKTLGIEVCAGPAEATAIGNIATQMITAGEFKNLREARECVTASFKIKNYRY